MSSPSRLLAEKIVDRLIAEKLIAPEQRDKLLDRLADGKLRPEDWRLPIETAQGKGGKP